MSRGDKTDEKYGMKRHNFKDTEQRKHKNAASVHAAFFSMKDITGTIDQIY